MVGSVESAALEHLKSLYGLLVAYAKSSVSHNSAQMSQIGSDRGYQLVLNSPVSMYNCLACFVYFLDLEIYVTRFFI